MLKNNGKAMICHIGICIAIGYTGGLSPSILRQVFFTIVVVGMYVMLGTVLENKGSKFKNLMSVSLVSLVCLLFSAYVVLVYQFDVVSINYASETLHYKIARIIGFAVNMSVVPTAGLIGCTGFYLLPYGLLFTFFIPSLTLWIGIEHKKRVTIRKMRMCNNK